MKVPLLSPAQVGDPWYWRWGRPVLYIAVGLLMMALAGRGVVTLVEGNDAVAALATIQNISALWEGFRTGLTTGAVVDRVAVATASALVLVAQLGKLVSVVGGLLLLWEVVRAIGEKVGFVKIVERDAEPPNADKKGDGQHD